MPRELGYVHPNKEVLQARVREQRTPGALPRPPLVLPPVIDKIVLALAAWQGGETCTVVVTRLQQATIVHHKRDPGARPNQAPHALQMQIPQRDNTFIQLLTRSWRVFSAM